MTTGIPWMAALAAATDGVGLRPEQDVRLALCELGRKRWQPVEFSISETVIQHYIFLPSMYPISRNPAGMPRCGPR